MGIGNSGDLEQYRCEFVTYSTAYDEEHYYTGGTKGVVEHGKTWTEADPDEHPATAGIVAGEDATGRA